MWGTCSCVGMSVGVMGITVCADVWGTCVLKHHDNSMKSPYARGIPLGSHFIVYAWQISAKELAVLRKGVSTVTEHFT